MSEAGMSPDLDETRAIACNYAVGTGVAAAGAKAYLIGPNVLV